MNKFMQEAIKEAYEGIDANDGGPFGCVIVKNGEIIAKAHNTVVKDNDPTAHGEINAIKKASKLLGTFNLKGCELYTTGYPCPMCLAACQWAGITKIFYGCNLKDTYEIGFKDLQFYKTKLKPKEVGRKECKELYSVYKAKEDKTQY